MHSWFNLHVGLQSGNCLLLDASEMSMIQDGKDHNSQRTMKATPDNAWICMFLSPARAAGAEDFPHHYLELFFACGCRIAMFCCDFELYLGALFVLSLTWFDFFSASKIFQVLSISTFLRQTSPSRGQKSLGLRRLKKMAGGSIESSSEIQRKLSYAPLQTHQDLSYLIARKCLGIRQHINGRSSGSNWWRYVGTI